MFTRHPAYGMKGAGGTPGSSCPCPKSCLRKTTSTCAGSWSRRCRMPATRSCPTTTACAAYQRLREEPFELLLTDIVMPEMDGIELARRAAELDPDIKIMFITGFAAVALNSEFERAEARQGAFQADPPARAGQRSAEDAGGVRTRGSFDRPRRRNDLRYIAAGTRASGSVASRPTAGAIRGDCRPQTRHCRDLRNLRVGKPGLEPFQTLARRRTESGY